MPNAWFSTRLLLIRLRVRGGESCQYRMGPTRVVTLAVRGVERRPSLFRRLVDSSRRRRNRRDFPSAADAPVVKDLFRVHDVRSVLRRLQPGRHRAHPHHGCEDVFVRVKLTGGVHDPRRRRRETRFTTNKIRSAQSRVFSSTDGVPSTSATTARGFPPRQSRVRDLGTESTRRAARARRRARRPERRDVTPLALTLALL